MSAEPRNAPTHGVPSDGEDDAEQHRGEESQLSSRQRVLRAVEEVDLDDAEKVQSEGDDHQAAHHVDGTLILDEERAHRRSQSSHSDEHAREAEHKAEGVAQHH